MVSLRTAVKPIAGRMNLHATFMTKPGLPNVDITLRTGLRFHDGAPVLGRDAVASIKRWAAVDSLGQSLMARMDELSAPDDRTIRFRLREPFPLLPLALGKAQPNMLAIMPERLASMPATANMTEMVRSGPFRIVANEAVPGDRFI